MFKFLTKNLSLIVFAFIAILLVSIGGIVIYYNYYKTPSLTEASKQEVSQEERQLRPIIEKCNSTKSELSKDDFLEAEINYEEESCYFVTAILEKEKLVCENLINGSYNKCVCSALVDFYNNDKTRKDDLLFILENTDKRPYSMVYETVTYDLKESLYKEAWPNLYNQQKPQKAYVDAKCPVTANTLKEWNIDNNEVFFTTVITYAITRQDSSLCGALTDSCSKCHCNSLVNLFNNNVAIKDKLLDNKTEGYFYLEHDSYYGLESAPTFIDWLFKTNEAQTVTKQNCPSCPISPVSEALIHNSRIKECMFTIAKNADYDLFGSKIEDNDYSLLSWSSIFEYSGCYPTVHHTEDKYCAYIKLENEMPDKYLCIDYRGKRGPYVIETSVNPSLAGYCTNSSFRCPPQQSID